MAKAQEMTERRCTVIVIAENGAKMTLERYARNFAELYHTLHVIERVRKVISYTVVR